FACRGEKCADRAVEFARFPQPQTFTTAAAKKSGKTTMQAAAVTNPTSVYFPPFTHFVLLYRENHTFDDYLGDCQSTVATNGQTCNGVVQSTNAMSSVPNLHTLARTYGLADAYNTGTQPPSGPNHWWMFSGQSA